LEVRKKRNKHLFRKTDFYFISREGGKGKEWGVFSPHRTKKKKKRSGDLRALPKKKKLDHVVLFQRGKKGEKRERERTEGERKVKPVIGKDGILI